MSTRKFLAIGVSALLGASMLLPSSPAEARPPSAVPGEEAYQTSMNGSIGGYSNGGSVISHDPIPADRRLVIEFVSVTMIVQPGQKPSVYMYGSVMGTGLPYRIPLALDASGSYGEIYRGTQSLRLYVDGDGRYGPQMQCSVEVAVGTPVGCSANVSGYLVGR